MWSRCVPESEGDYWFIPRKKCLYPMVLVHCHKIVNGFSYVSEGTFLYNHEGLWAKVEYPVMDISMDGDK